MSEPTTMCEAFQASAARDPEAVALRTDVGFPNLRS
jgi:hypothetical protein